MTYYDCALLHLLTHATALIFEDQLLHIRLYNILGLRLGTLIRKAVERESLVKTLRVYNLHHTSITSIINSSGFLGLVL